MVKLRQKSIELCLVPPGLHPACMSMVEQDLEEGGSCTRACGQIGMPPCNKQLHIAISSTQPQPFLTCTASTLEHETTFPDLQKRLQVAKLIRQLARALRPGTPGQSSGTPEARAFFLQRPRHPVAADNQTRCRAPD